MVGNRRVGIAQGVERGTEVLRGPLMPRPRGGANVELVADFAGYFVYHIRCYAFLWVSDGAVAFVTEWWMVVYFEYVPQLFTWHEAYCEIEFAPFDGVLHGSCEWFTYVGDLDEGLGW